MARTADLLASRLQFDWRVCQAMNNEVVHATAYRTTSDLKAQRNPIASLADAQHATKYHVVFRVPTLGGRNRPLIPETVVGVDLSTGNYPDTEPATWIISKDVPYSPHFAPNRPVCIGSIWQRAQGDMLLGELFIHIAKLLNWDEVPRGSGYVGWNGDAIKLHAEQYRGKPITPRLRYPALPVDLVHAVDPAAPDALFAPAMTGTEVDADTLFAPRGGFR